MQTSLSDYLSCSLKAFLHVSGASLLVVLGSATSTHALVTTSFSGDTTGGPTWQRPAGCLTCLSPDNTYRYQFSPFNVSESGSYAVTTSTTGWDGYLFIYGDTFDPASPLTNLLELDDDFESTSQSQVIFSFSSGQTYHYVQSGFFTSAFGAFTGTFEGPGDVQFSAFSAPSEVPGPLPILGAAAAFGYSRKLRRRLKTKLY
jgi:hypothetical protein